MKWLAIKLILNIEVLHLIKFDCNRSQRNEECPRYFLIVRFVKEKKLA